MIRRLQAQRFRNLEDLDWRLDAGVHFLFGRTGQGKTSLLEALYLAATSRSFRTHRLELCARRASVPSEERRDRREPSDLGEGAGESASGFWLAAEIEDADRRSRLELSWGSAGGIERRIDGEIAPATRYLEAQNVVVWTSGDLEILVGAPQHRRRLLDRGVVALRPAALRTLSTYRRALQQRRHLLASGRRDVAEMESWNQLLAAAGSDLIRRRQEYALLLDQQLQEATRWLGLTWPAPRIVYRSSPRDGSDPDRFTAALRRTMDEEWRRRRPLVGPHLDSVEFSWHGAPLAERASAGERKAHGLVLTGAQILVLEQAGREPIVLLDDLDTELDAELLLRFAPLLERTSQTVVTSNRRSVFEPLLAAGAPPSSREREPVEEAGDRRQDGPRRRFSWNLEEGRVQRL
ncbi:MAG: hypothetical protein DWQ36_25010 [Acidobacteria bacterium]|nr:MAG: hypothetical protein DWQ30_11050 [Acidobacteriota bacterium]REJ99593.1 MAG: hypothetical protein DWQ36_25010 [Acidobacteriota bacterium]